jgi:prepilin-type processing-associated H-X9-DG protein
MNFVSRFATAAIAIVGLMSAGNLAAAPISPVDRVPADAGLFAHLSVGNLWEHPTIVDLRKAYAADLEKALKEVEKETGLRPEQIQSVTFHYPKIPQGSGDETLFVLQIVTKKPYDKDKVLIGFRPKGATANGDVIKLEAKMVAHLTTETQLTILHETLLDEFKKGATKTTEGVMKEAIQAAKAGKNALVVGLDPSGLPAEIFDNAPEELKPFLPLLKSKSIVLQANLEKDVSAEIRFVGESEDKAIESERAFNLLMKLADDGITAVLKDEKADDELKALFPTLMQVQKVVQGIKAQRQGNVTTAKASIKADANLAKPLVALFLKPQAAAARSRSQNNLKQIGLALHNYHDTYGVFPASAIVDKKGKPLLSWRVAILPYIEQNNLYKQFHLDEPWDSEHNKPLAETIIKVYQLPYGESKPGITHYRGFVGNGAVFEPIQGSKISQITDGTSNTLFVIEAAEGVPWSKPDDIEFDPKKPMVKHLRFEKGICNVLFCDGSVRAFPNKIKDEVLKLLIQKDDGQPIPDFD